MSYHKTIWVLCIIFLVMSIFCWSSPVSNQTFPWSWPSGGPFPVYGQLPLTSWPVASYYPTAGLSTTSGWPPYIPPPGYAPIATTILSSSTGCPVGLVTGLTLEEEFGPGAGQLTRCVAIRNNIKVVVRLNHLEYTPGTPITRVLTTMLDDYAITNGTRDFKIAAIVHSAGLPLVLNRNILTPHPDAILNDQQLVVEDLIARGVKFYL